MERCARHARPADHRLDKSPFGVAQITRIAQAMSVSCAAVLGCPHRAPVQIRRTSMNHNRFIQLNKFLDRLFIIDLDQSVLLTNYSI